MMSAMCSTLPGMPQIELALSHWNCVHGWVDWQEGQTKLPD
jgi:hypothetical protein